MKLKNYHEQAQYVTLFGHRMRLQLTINAKESYKILTTNNNGSTSYRSIVALICDKLIEVHPLISSSIVIKPSENKTIKKSNSSSSSKQRSKRTS